MSTAITPPTPENVAELFTGGDNDFHDGYGWHPSLSATGNVVSIEIEPLDEDGNRLPEVHFRAVVVEGETEPIVLPRLNTDEYSEHFEGGAFEDDAVEGWQAVFYSHAKKRTCFPWEADSVLFRGAPGVISPAEARRFASALVSLADAVEASQAVQNGGKP